jgi:hypothetical protein
MTGAHGFEVAGEDADLAITAVMMMARRGSAEGPLPRANQRRLGNVVTGQRLQDARCPIMLPRAEDSVAEITPA